MDDRLFGYRDYCNLYHELKNLSFNAIGEEYCKPEHSNGPKIRSPFLFHFIVSGEGVFEIQNKRYHLTANQGFLIPNSSIIFYQADKQNPWHYCWLNLQGKAAEEFFENLSLSESNPIYTAKPENNIYSSFKELLVQAKSFNSTSYGTIAALYNCMNSISTSSINAKDQPKESQQYLYVKNAELYIASNYHRSDLRIDDIAKYIGINRSYLSRLFAVYHNTSPQQYLINIRMQKAQSLLASTRAPIYIIASSVGYDDLFIFSKIYKKHFGLSPKKDRELHSKL